MGALMLSIEPLAKHHDRKTFDCGNDDLNRYLQTMANQHAKKGLSKTHVLIDSDNPSQILGFFTLVIGSIEPKDITAYPKNLPIPSVLIGRLAVANHAKGNGLSDFLMFKAFEMIKQIAKLAGVAFVTVEPKTFELTAYYERLGFVKTANPLFMLLSVNNI